jgi:hypothetical protein
MSEKTPEANRFRFRIWDIEANRFYTDEAAADIGLCLAPTGKIHFWTPSGDRESGLDYIICQSTGLLDKNGKEIFEGDILTWDCFTRAVEWDFELAAFLYSPHRGSIVPVGIHNRRAEIIGNIYENLELLKH